MSQCTRLSMIVAIRPVLGHHVLNSTVHIQQRRIACCHCGSGRTECWQVTIGHMLPAVADRRHAGNAPRHANMTLHGQGGGAIFRGLDQSHSEELYERRAYYIHARMDQLRHDQLVYQQVLHHFKREVSHGPRFCSPDVCIGRIKWTKDLSTWLISEHMQHPLGGARHDGVRHDGELISIERIHHNINSLDGDCETYRIPRISIYQLDVKPQKAPIYHDESGS
jgi:hypothetical protein